ncbi:MAG TPA: multiheme c-type cytochrome [candidate division Zixibacteria bacterium]|nr:multiheme c-type cytochrome [candidate division Zixibacteria bacterium]
MRFLNIVILLWAVAASGAAAQTAASADACEDCHQKQTAGLHRQWQESLHGQYGVGCRDCHAAAEGDPDAFAHNGALIATLVTPADCRACHEKEATEVERSYHATAGQILESNDAYLAHVAGGAPAAIAGCENCHGAKVQIDPNRPNRLARQSWPNAGIGRINPDGSKGSCTACHTRHTFSAAQARRPEACGKCHLGPDHPQREIYDESKHGNAFCTNVDKMKLAGDSWVVGRDYAAAPTCATCHIGATPASPGTHDVGERISWTLRPAVSVHKENWQEKRAAMKRVCANCHGGGFVDGHYYQYDAVVALYNEKFARPAGEILARVRAQGLLERPASFGNEIEWTYWEIWHHEGRRARHGAAMMGPDYTWWHGLYEVAKHFYFGLLPEARAYGNAAVNAYIDSLLANDPMHAWVNRETDQLTREIRSGKMQEIYEAMFPEQ